jgi:hypothetical protein
MAPKFARTIIKRHLTRIINLAEAYETTVMTSEAFSEAEKLEKKLNGFHKTYEIFSIRILEEEDYIDEATFEADVNTMEQTADEVRAARIIVKTRRREWSNAEEVKKREEEQRIKNEAEEVKWRNELEARRVKCEKIVLETKQLMANQAANPTVNQDQLIRDIVIQKITAIYSVPVFTPGAVNRLPAAFQNLNSLQPVIDLKDVAALRNLQFKIEPSDLNLTTSQFAAAYIPDPIQPVKSSLATESCCVSNFPSYQSKENIQKEGMETGTTSLPHPPKKGDSLSESPDGPEGYPDNKRFEKDDNQRK